MRTPLLAGNWKLHLTIGEAVELATALKEKIGDAKGREVMVAPVYTAVAAVAEAVAGSPVAVGAQDLYWEEKGAFTGEVSAPLLRDAGCTSVIIGHSERRQLFGETDETANRRVRAAVTGGLAPILCVGESLEEREAGREQEVVAAQVRNGLAGMTAADAENLVLAYEPVWAIGTGKTATPLQADEMHSWIRGLLSEIFGDIVSARLRILYGGSVKPENVDELMAKEHIDGALVGGASLKADSFARIVNFEAT
jgi:triosephosphate isomerase